MDYIDINGNEIFLDFETKGKNFYLINNDDVFTITNFINYLPPVSSSEKRKNGIGIFIIIIIVVIVVMISATTVSMTG